MIKKIIILLSVLILFCGCQGIETPVNNVKIINAENMQGAVIENDIKSDKSSDYTYFSETTDSDGFIYTGNYESSEIINETITSNAASTTVQTSTIQTTSEPSQKISPQTVPPAETAESIIKNTTSEETTATKTTHEETTAIKTTAAETTSSKTVSGSSTYKPLNYENTVGVWISYIELSSALKGKNEAEFRKNFSVMMDNCVSIGINTVYVHLRPFGDAVYKSALFPWSSYVTGTLGLSPSFDPLTVMLEEAHSRNISFQGWINPMRISSASEISSLSTEYLTGKWYNSEKKGNYIVKNGDYWYLNPAYDEVIKLVADGASEIVGNYNVDGLHIDDYFYPTTDAAFDKIAFNASGAVDLSEFRQSRCSKLVKSIYDAVKKANPNVLFGISPQGSVENNYNYLYADVKKWCGTQGYCDYIAPQIYYGFENASQPFDLCLSAWHEMTRNTSVKVIPGLAVYKVGKEDVWAGNGGRNEWINNNDILKRQIITAQEYDGYNGVIFYSYNYLFNSDYVTSAHKAEINAMLPLLK